MTPSTALAFYLPQYHPTPENDLFWGKGFTEWFSVTKARPLFPGHYQPHRPADLGFYDLRLPQTRAAQASMAHDAGLGGFVMYHYWSKGRRLLHEPVDGFFADKETAIKYALCWANESWTMEWRGQDHHVTLSQEYSEEDDIEHAEFLTERFFSNPRYLRHHGRPVFIVYHPQLLPNPRHTISALREAASRAGLDLYLGGGAAFDEHDPSQFGLDFSVRWSPAWSAIAPAFDQRRSKAVRGAGRLMRKHRPDLRGVQIYDYNEAIKQHVGRPKEAWPTAETVFPSWDNTARRQHGEALMFRGSTPERFEAWLRATQERLRPSDPPFVFVNAWNEWAEGCHLEPCERYGHAWLDACRAVFSVDAPEAGVDLTDAQAQRAR